MYERYKIAEKKRAVYARDQKKARSRKNLYAELATLGEELDREFQGAPDAAKRLPFLGNDGNGSGGDHGSNVYRPPETRDTLANCAFLVLKKPLTRQYFFGLMSSTLSMEAAAAQLATLVDAPGHTPEGERARRRRRGQQIVKFALCMIPFIMQLRICNQQRGRAFGVAWGQTLRSLNVQDVALRVLNRLGQCASIGELNLYENEFASLLVAVVKEEFKRDPTTRVGVVIDNALLKLNTARQTASRASHEDVDFTVVILVLLKARLELSSATLKYHCVGPRDSVLLGHSPPELRASVVFSDAPLTAITPELSLAPPRIGQDATYWGVTDAGGCRGGMASTHLAVIGFKYCMARIEY